MIFIGYEEGSRAYRAYDPLTKKVHVTRDIIFEEGRPWCWNAPGAPSPHSGQGWNAQDAPSARTTSTTFTVVYTTENGTEELDAGTDAARFSSPAPASTSMASPSEPHTPDATTMTRWATPPTHDDGRDVDSGPIRYRRLSSVLDETEEFAEHESFERCLLSAEEPRDVTEAFDDAAWKAAMDDEMASILDNKT
jgi:hypothetical protein